MPEKTEPVRMPTKPEDDQPLREYIRRLPDEMDESNRLAFQARRAECFQTRKIF